MRTVVIGVGRSGTNMALEMLRASGHFNASEPPENKRIFKEGTVFYCKNYLTKCDLTYCRMIEFNATLNTDDDLKLVFTIRDPRDMAMSKLYRGQPYSKGGDCPVVSDDGTPGGCIESIKTAYRFYNHLKANHKSRFKLVKMEDIILKTEDISRELADWIGFEYNLEMTRFYEYMRENKKKRRYKGIDKTQVGMWKNWQDYYGGFLKKYDMEEIFRRLDYIVKEFNYEI